MLSYLHGYHAGNFADVHKHCTLMLVLQKLKQKNAPITFIDTHSGSGLYDLQEATAQKTGEYQHGVGALEQAHIQGKISTPTLLDYLSLIEAVQNNKQTTFEGKIYPGSPAIAQHLLREHDFGLLMELHNNEIGKLKQFFKRDGRLNIHHRNGFEGLAALTPPATPRGVALIDPSYELVSDYHDVFTALQTATQRWRTGIFAVWYPILAGEKNHAPFIKRKLAQLDCNNALVSELHIQPSAQAEGMTGSGMAIINVPWQLDTDLKALTDALQTHLDQGFKTESRLEWIKEKA